MDRGLRLAEICRNVHVLTRGPGNPITPVSPLLSAWNKSTKKDQRKSHAVVYVYAYVNIYVWGNVYARPWVTTYYISSFSFQTLKSWRSLK